MLFSMRRAAAHFPLTAWLECMFKFCLNEEQYSRDPSDFLSQRPIELKALSVQEALHVKEVTSIIAEKEIQSSVANRALPK